MLTFLWIFSVMYFCRIMSRYWDPFKNGLYDALIKSKLCIMVFFKMIFPNLQNFLCLPSFIYFVIFSHHKAYFRFSFSFTYWLRQTMGIIIFEIYFKFFNFSFSCNLFAFFTSFFAMQLTVLYSWIVATCGFL